MKKKLIFLLPILLLASVNLMAQTLVEGLVTTSEGVPLPGATVVIKGGGVPISKACIGRYVQSLG